MGGSLKPKSPKAPDPYQTAGADFAYNNLSQDTPWGSLDITAPQFGANRQLTQPGTATYNLSPEMQNIFNSQMGISQESLNEASRRQGQMGSLPGLASGIDPSIYAGTDASDVAGNLFQRSRGLLDPVFAERERELRTRLSNQGLPQTGEAYSHDIDEFGRQRGRAYSDAALDATLASDAESRARRQQATGEFLTNQNVAGNTRATMINELAQILGQQQVQTPGLQSFFAPGGGDFMGAQGLNLAAQNAAYGGQQDLLGGGLSGLFNLGAAAIGSNSGWGGLFNFGSHSSLKDVLGEVDGILDGLKQIRVYRWKYRGKDETHIGPMAEDFQRVFGVGDGYTLNPADMLGVMIGAMKEIADKRLQA